MRNSIFSFILILLPIFSFAQFAPTEKGLTIIVTDGTLDGVRSTVQPPGDLRFQDPIRPLGMADAIQAGAFVDRPDYGLAGYILVFCVNDSIGDQQGSLVVNGQLFYGVYRLIRQKRSVDEEIPEGMTSFRLSGTVYFLGIS
ncbi:MAG TPA: hypothetical protein ENK52_02370 [Saprospiraceae bacterium]|nr:hypothetical protein [Saprospiraceae bacterium]